MITITMKRKNTPKNKVKLSKINNTTAIFGYSLFAITILNQIFFTIIPLSSAMTYPGARYFNIIVLIIAIAVSALLPALGSYILGDRATHSKNKALHHYNGVLFGIAAFWVSSVLGFIGWRGILVPADMPAPLSNVILFGIPVALTIIVMAVVAVLYAKNKKRTHSVLEYLPYQIVLLVSVAAIYLSYNTFGTYNSIEERIIGIASLAFPIILTLISYIVLAKHHTSRRTRLTDAAAAMSFGYIASIAIGSFVANFNPYWTAVFGWSYAFGILVWAAYLYLRNRKTR